MTKVTTSGSRLRVKMLKIRGLLYSKFSFGEVYRQIYSRKSRFTGRASGAVKRDFQTHIQRYTSPNVFFEYVYSHFNALLQFEPKLERCKPHKGAHHPTKCDVNNDVKLFPTVYRILKCIRNIILFDLILYIQSTIFQLNRDGSSWVEPVLS